MNADGDPTILCWNCIKGRHAICTGKIPEQEGDAADWGQDCECPVCHGNRYQERQPVWDSARQVYYDPGPGHERRQDW